MQRRLPVYLLIDTSGSMSGQPIAAVNEGLQMLINTLRSDPQALETAYISVITFNSKAEQIVPLTELSAFQPQKVKASGTTAIGEALSLLAASIKSEVRSASGRQKADWKPLVFLLSDGGATDNLEKGIADLQSVKTGLIICCAAGKGADIDELKKISPTVVSLDTVDSETLAGFFAWVSHSIAVTSQKVDLTKKDVGSSIDNLPPPPPEVNVVL